MNAAIRVFSHDMGGDVGYVRLAVVENEHEAAHAIRQGARACKLMGKALYVDVVTAEAHRGSKLVDRYVPSIEIDSSVLCDVVDERTDEEAAETLCRWLSIKGID